MASDSESTNRMGPFLSLAWLALECGTRIKNDEQYTFSVEKRNFETWQLEKDRPIQTRSNHRVLSLAFSDQFSVFDDSRNNYDPP
jgi:hypothetical protein